MKWLLRIGIGLGVILILALVVGYVFLDSIVKKGVETAGPAITKVDVKLGSASISPFSGSGKLKKFVVGNPEGYKTASAIEMGAVEVSIVPKSIMGDKVIVRSIRIEGPEITFEGSLSGNNLSKILSNVQGSDTKPDPSKPATKAEQKANRKLQVDDFVLTGGKIHISATLLNGQSATVPLPEIHFSNLGQGPDGITAKELTAKVLDRVTVESVKAVGGAISGIGKEAVGTVRSIGTNATKHAEGVIKGVGDIFKKK